MIKIQTQMEIQKVQIHIQMHMKKRYATKMKIHTPQTAQWHSSQRKTSPITYLKYQSSSSSKSYLVNIIQIIIFINIQIIISIIISSLFSLLFSSTWLAATPRLSLTIFRWKLWADLKWLKSETHSTFWPNYLNSYFSSLCVSYFRFRAFGRAAILLSILIKFSRPRNPHICSGFWQFWFSPEKYIYQLYELLFLEPFL